MKFLIDTNIIVPLEPVLISDLEVNTDLALEFHRLSQRSKNTLYVHPSIQYDIQRDKVKDRANLRRTLLQRYELIESPPSNGILEKKLVGDPEKGSNDYVDNCLLASLRELQNIKIPFIMSSNFKSIGDEYEDIYFESKWHIITSNKFDRAFD